MDYEPRAFKKAPLNPQSVSTGTPLPCRRAMSAQVLTAWTPVAVVGALFSAILAVPRALVLAPSVIRRRA